MSVRAILQGLLIAVLITSLAGCTTPVETQGTEEPNVTEPLKVENAQLQNSSFENVDMSGSTFRGVNLSGCTFDDINFGQCTINNVTLGASKITHSCFTQLEIDGNLTDMVINGVPLRELIDAWEQAKGRKFP